MPFGWVESYEMRKYIKELMCDGWWLGYGKYCARGTLIVIADAIALASSLR
jgi:hypothetical protein